MPDPLLSAARSAARWIAAHARGVEGFAVALAELRAGIAAAEAGAPSRDAAPELLAACKLMLCELGYLYDQTKSREGGSVWKARQAGRAAIARTEEVADA